MFLIKKTYAKYYVKFINNTATELQAQVDHILYVRSHDRLPIFETSKKKKILPKKWHYIKNHDYILLENKYRIEIKKIETPCSWVNIFSYFKNVHGVGLELIINSVSRGIICANKRNIIDYCYNANLSYENATGYEYFKFTNSGWWQNESVFPVSIELKLTEIAPN